MDRVRALAAETFMALECSGLARVDFFLDRKTGDFYFNEINTMPGFTSISMYPKMMRYQACPTPIFSPELLIWHWTGTGQEAL
jgi:D-alanine-D-alanine ligase